MARVKLVHIGPNEPFSQEVERLVDFLLEYPSLWNVAIDYLRDVLPNHPLEFRRQQFEAVAETYGVMSMPAVEWLWKLCEELYDRSRSSPGDERADIVECFVVRVGPVSAPATKVERAVHAQVREGDGRILRGLEEYKYSSFDVCFMGEGTFEGHECKVKIANFVRVARPFSGSAERKLRFLELTRERLTELGLHAEVYLTGLDRGAEKWADVLNSHGFWHVRVIGAEALGALLSTG